MAPVKQMTASSGCSSTYWSGSADDMSADDSIGDAQALQELRLPPAPTTRIAKQLTKTRYCKHYLRRGSCRYEANCAYAHQVQELVVKPDLTKTKFCVNFLSGACFQDNCTYAHGSNEIRKASSQSNASPPAQATTRSPAKQILGSPKYSLDSKVNNVNSAFGEQMSLVPDLPPGSAPMLANLPPSTQQVSWLAGAERAAENVFRGESHQRQGRVGWLHAQEQEKVWQAMTEVHLLNSFLIQMKGLVPEEQRKSVNLHQIIQSYPKPPEAWSSRNEQTPVPESVTASRWPFMASVP